MTKHELRKFYLQKRLSLSEQECLQLSQQISDLFFSAIDLSFIKVLHSFLPLEKNKEPNTWLIIDRIRREFPHIRLSLPRINSVTGALENFYFEDLHQLESNRWGISEPKHGTPTALQEIDMVLVPLLAFDQQGNRVGYGKGFYDKFLSTCNSACIKVGLSFSEAIPAIEDVTPLDIPLNYCITPKALYKF